ncbi:hypothetical protein SBOR_0954 [Sclerotinia borealis F-4128]|uniref:Uncharacterized protein n=1 Tax=Sclerotinia borealis (strain F-4128) TaxID=1432307 RepID=W9CS72_SCLBF|nr:hypothetical protein SBOR_0954 [Sclerotinia borealis F-4128]
MANKTIHHYGSTVSPMLRARKADAASPNGFNRSLQGFPKVEWQSKRNIPRRQGCQNIWSGSAPLSLPRVSQEQSVNLILAESLECTMVGERQGGTMSLNPRMGREAQSYYYFYSDKPWRSPSPSSRSLQMFGSLDDDDIRPLENFLPSRPTIQLVPGEGIPRILEATDIRNTPCLYPTATNNSTPMKGVTNAKYHNPHPQRQFLIPPGSKFSTTSLSSTQCTRRPAWSRSRLAKSSHSSIF